MSPCPAQALEVGVLARAAKTSQPAPFSRSAVASPIPVEAPVTSTVFAIGADPTGRGEPRRLLT